MRTPNQRRFHPFTPTSSSATPRLGTKPADRYARGQSMVIVGLLLVVLLGMLALILDGGYAFLQRRAAQTAADAGALAGATIFCRTGNVSLATSTALDYAIQRNHALEATVSIIDGVVEVTTRIPFPTFFGRVLGVPSMTASAVAAATCFPPAGATGVLPVAWNCPPDDTYMGTDGYKHCDMQLNDPNELYIIMNSRKVDEDLYCIEDGGTVNCDPDGDGYNELLVGGNRTWLDLSGSGSDNGNGSSELAYWIKNGFPNEVSIHTWFAGQPGVSVNVFMSVYSIVGHDVLLPVYNAITSGPPPAPYWDDPADRTVWSNGASTTYYHVITFSMFRVTCVRAKGSDSCPFFEELRSDGTLDPDDKTIEGYFVSGTSPDLSGQGEVYAGAYTLYLTR